MKDFFSYYEILELKEAADLEEIKKAYREKALQYHPDRVPEHLKKKSEEIFKQISEAYEALSDPEKRKKYDEGLKNLKASQASGQGGSDGSPVVRVDKNYFKFEYLKLNVSVSDILTVFNEGGGVLVGTIMADKPWVKLSETVISTPDYQEIEITIDTTSFTPGFSDSGLIEVETNGGKETVTIDISLELSFLAIFLAYIQPVAKSFWAWALVTVLSALFLISCLIYSCNRSMVINRISQPVINKTSQPEETVVVIPEIPKLVYAPKVYIPTLKDLEGKWFGKIDSSFCFLSISPKQDYFEGKFFYQGVIGKIKGKIKDDGEIVFEIENYEDVFNDFIDRKVSFSEFLSSPFFARLKEEKIEASGWKSFSFSKVQTSQWLILEALISKIEDSDRFKTLKVVYDVEFDKVWEAALKILERRKERIRYENKEERIIITYITEHSSLLGDYAHKYVILFEEEGKTTEFILKLFRYEKGVSRNCYSLSSRPTYAADRYFFLSLEGELKRMSKKKDIVINRLYFREGPLSKKMKILAKPIKIVKHRIEEIISLGSVRYVNDE